MLDAVPFELKLDDGAIVTWHGKSGEAAARSYNENHQPPLAQAIAWRWPRWHLGIGFAPGMILEPGDPGYQRRERPRG